MTSSRGSNSAHKRTAVISPARLAAFQILQSVEEGRGHSDDLLHSQRIDKLSVEDRALATALVMGVLRWQILLDVRVASLLSRPDQKLAPTIAIPLRLGAFQLLHMDRIPAHAALNESVELCRSAGQPQAAGMVNAVLRRMTRMRGDLDTTADAVAAHPRWLVDRWIAAYGLQQTHAVCEYDQREPAAGDMFMPGAAELPGIDNGSRLVAEIAAAAIPEQNPSPSVWDACAAPGGKTLVLARRLPEARILSTDISARRTARMQRRVEQFGYARHVRCAVLDAAQPELPTNSEGFDLVLCDVPCSGTGTLARNPEIRLRISAKEFPRQAARQREILSAALARLRPGGRLLYSTCSLEREENDDVVEFASGSSGVRQLDVSPVLEGLVATDVLRPSSAELLRKTAVVGGSLRTLPGVHPCDGFFATLLERVA